MTVGDVGASPARVPEGRSETTIAVRVRFFAFYRELVGRSRLTVQVPPRSTVAELVSHLRRDVELEALPADPTVAVNQEYVTAARRLSPGDEVAFIPPVAGG